MSPEFLLIIQSLVINLFILGKFSKPINFIMKLNSINHKHCSKMKVISSSAKSVLLNDPDIVLLRKEYPK